MRNEIQLIILLVLSPARTIGEFGYPIKLLVKGLKRYPTKYRLYSMFAANLTYWLSRYQRDSSQAWTRWRLGSQRMAGRTTVI